MWVNLDKRAKNSNYEFNVITVVLSVFRKSKITTMKTQISLAYEFYLSNSSSFHFLSGLIGILSPE